MRRSMLTTIDNPYDPFVYFDEWNEYDMRKGYHTLSFLARIVVSSPELSETLQEEAVEVAIDEIIFENINGKYKKVTNEVDEE